MLHACSNAPINVKPHLPQVGQTWGLLGICKCENANSPPLGTTLSYKSPTNYPGITTVWKSTDIRVANAPTWGQPWVTNPHLLPENLLLGMLQIFLGHDLSAHHP